MAKPDHTPLDQSLVMLGVKRGEASPSPSLRPSASESQATSPRHEEAREPSSISGTLFASKPLTEPRAGITIRIKVTAAIKLDNLARRTGRTKQELLDTAIQQLLDEADRVGNLTAPI